MTDYSSNNSVLQTFDSLFELPVAVIKRFQSDRLPRHASALAFSSLLALAPMMAIALSMLSLFSSFDGVSDSVETFIYKFLVPAAGDDIRVYLDGFASRAGKLTVVGLAAFLITALLMLANIESSFNDIWRVKKGRSFGRRLSVYWALVTLGPLLMGASLTMSTYLLSLSAVTGQVASAGAFVLPICLEVMAFWLLYLVMPNVRVSLMHSLVGALVASFLFELTKRAFASYVSNFASYEVVYGALATLPIFLIWVYLSWVVALIGAEVVAVLQQRRLLEHTVLDKIESNITGEPEVSHDDKRDALSSNSNEY